MVRLRWQAKCRRNPFPVGSLDRQRPGALVYIRARTQAAACFLNHHRMKKILHRSHARQCMHDSPHAQRKSDHGRWLGLLEDLRHENLARLVNLRPNSQARSIFTSLTEGPRRPPSRGHCS